MTLKQHSGRPSEEKTKKSSKKTKRSAQADKESVQLVAQEIKFARSLAGNDKKSRDKVLKTLSKWLTMRCQNGYVFKEDDFNRIWKGLFYAMWMSDKPLIQEELSESIAGLIDIFPEGKCEAAMLFFKCGLKSLATEWFGLDQHRMDKFLMFVRRLLRAAFRSVRREGWSLEACQHFDSALAAPDSVLAPQPPAYARNSLALLMHIVECYAEELAKVSEGQIGDTSLVRLLRPLGRCMALTAESRLSGCIKRHVFVYLLRQSDKGQEYESKKQAWIEMGCPEGGVDCLFSDDEEETQEGSDDESKRQTALDPRAGRIDTILPSLPVPARLLADMLRPLALCKESTTPNRKRIRVLLKHFDELASGDYPLRVKEELMAENAGVRKQIPRASTVARKLQEFEKKMIAQSDELAIRGLSRKHRKRVLAKTRERLASVDLGDSGTSQRDERSTEKIKAKKRRHNDNANSGEWQVEEVSKETKEIEKKSETNKRKVQSALADEVPLKKLKNILKQKEQKVKKSDKENAHVPNKRSVKRDDGKKIDSKPAKDNKVSENNKMTVQSKTLSEKKVTDRETTNEKLINQKVKSEELKSKKEKLHVPGKHKVLAKKLTPSNSKISSPEKKKSEKRVLEQKTKLRGKKSEKKEEIKMNGELKQATPKKVTIVLKNNTAQGPVDYYKSVKQSPNIPFDSTKKPTKTNLKPNSVPSPINPFFKKKLKLKL